MKAVTRLIQRPVEMKPVPGYEGLYSVTRDGRVWAHQRIDQAPADRRRGSFQRIYKAKWLRPHLIGHYLGVMLYRDGRGRNHYLHRLVMVTWGPSQPSSKHEVNHKNRVKTDNHISNLEWVTRLENAAHAKRPKKRAPDSTLYIPGAQGRKLPPIFDHPPIGRTRIPPQEPNELRRIPGLAGLYSVTCDGRVWAHERRVWHSWNGGSYITRKPKWRVPSRSGKYLSVQLTDAQGRHGSPAIHQLVMAAWGTAPPSRRHELNHRDGNRHNNHIDNLEWVTRRQNIHHAIANGHWVPITSIPKGSQHTNARFTEDDIIRIRKRHANGETITALAREFGVGWSHMWTITARRAWRHI